MERSDLNGEKCPTCNRTIRDGDGHQLMERYGNMVVACPME